MSVRAPERHRSEHRRTARKRKLAGRPAPQFGFTAPGAPLKTRVTRHRRRRRRARVRVLLVFTLAFAAASALVVVGSHPDAPRPVPPGPLPVSSLIAWSVTLGDRAFVAVIAIPPGRPAVALAVPGDTLVDLPSGSPTRVGAATGSPGELVASMQATFDQRIPHYVISSGVDLQNLIDRVGGIQVLVEEPFSWEDQTLGPGETP